MTSAFSYFIKLPFILICILCLFFVPLFYTNSNYINSSKPTINSSYGFMWPIPGYTNISSHFGKRSSPTSHASSYHSGIDIPAPEGTSLYAIAESKVIFASWGAGGGYTITLELLEYPEIKVSYCHVSPIMYVTKDDVILKGAPIGTVGPKNVYGIRNNPYTDSNGYPTNGATTRLSSSFYD